MNNQDNFNEDISDKNCENSNSPDIEIKEEWDDDSDDLADNSYEEKPESIEISEDSREAREQLIEVLETEENSDSGKQLNIEIQDVYTLDEGETPIKCSFSNDSKILTYEANRPMKFTSILKSKTKCSKCNKTFDDTG